VNNQPKEEQQEEPKRQPIKTKVKIIDPLDVEIPERTRVEFDTKDDKWEDFANNVSSFGVMQSIAVKEIGKKSEKVYSLVAGERRLKAALESEISVIPAVIFPQSTTDADLLELELIENFWRKNFTPAEEVTLLKKIHESKIAEYGKAHRGSKDKDLSKGWGVTETAKLTGKSVGQVSKDIKLARAMEVVPELKNAKNKATAHKQYSQMKQTIQKKVRADDFKNKMDKMPEDDRRLEMIKSFMVLKPKTNPLLSGVFEGITKIPDNKIDFIDLDSPYAIDIKSKKKREIKEDELLDKYNEISVETYPTWKQKLLKECYRVLRPDRFIVVWFAPDPWWEFELDWLKRAGFRVRGLPGIWYKQAGQNQQPNMYLTNDHEMFFYASKDRGTLNKPGRLSTFHYKPVPPMQKIHSTEKPVDLGEDMYYTFTGEGSEILIPCLGSGNGIMSAANISSKAYGWELDEELKDAYTVRVGENKPGLYTSYEKED